MGPRVSKSIVVLLSWARSFLKVILYFIQTQKGKFEKHIYCTYAVHSRPRKIVTTTFQVYELQTLEVVLILKKIHNSIFKTLLHKKDLS